MVDVTELIERLPSLESALGVEFEGLSATLEETEWSGTRLTVNCDVVAASGSLKTSIDVSIAAYNQSGEMVGLGYESFYEDDFEGIDSISEDLVVYDEPARILVYPRPS